MLARGGSASESFPTGTITFLLTDVVGSTRLWEEKSQAMSKAISRHDELVAEIVREYGGHLPLAQGEGDSALAVFSRASHAVAAALRLQMEFISDPPLADVGIRVRMALHTGDAELRGASYFGTVVNRTARLRSIAHAGQVLMSQVTYGLVRDTLPEGASLKDLGLHRLRDLSRPERVYQLNHPALPREYPPLGSLEAVPNNLPLRLTSFVDREAEIAEIKQTLSAKHLLTLTGPGGGGKTRLAIQAAAEMLEQFPDGVWLVELSSLSDPNLVARQVAGVIGVREGGETAGEPNPVTAAAPSDGPSDSPPGLVEAVRDALRSKEALMIIDNCEHLVEGVVPLLRALLPASDTLRVIATSRQRLGMEGEVTRAVPPLSFPDPGPLPSLEELGEYHSISLFLDRAALVRAGVRLTSENAPWIAEIGRRLGGIPLAIELAAARLNILSPKQIAERLTDRFQLLGTDRGVQMSGLPTLRAVMDWSHDLLSDQEATLFRRLAVFEGGFFIDAAEHVGTGSDIAANDVLGLLSALADKSLVSVEPMEEQDRYSMQETVQEYAREGLSESGEQENMQQRHFEWFNELAGRAAEHLIGPDQDAWLDLLELEHDNLRASLEWTLASGRRKDGVGLAGALWLFWGMRGYLSEGRRRLDQVLAIDPPSATREELRAVRGAGVLARYQGDYGTARTLLERALSMAREMGNRNGVGESLLNLGYLSAAQGDYARARNDLSEALEIARTTGNRWGAGIAASNLGIVACSQGDYGAARAFLEEGLALVRPSGDKWSLGFALGNLGTVAAAQGDYASACVLLEEAYHNARELGEKRSIAISQIDMGKVSFWQGDLVVARTHLESGLALAREVGDKRAIGLALSYLGAVMVHERELERARPILEEATSIARSIDSKQLLASSLVAVSALEGAEGRPKRGEEAVIQALSLRRRLSDRLGMAESLEQAASLAASRGNFERAALLLGAADSLRTTIGAPIPPVSRPQIEATEASAREGLVGDFESVWSAGAAMNGDEAAVYAGAAP